jgi:hypothetical protein
MNNNTTFAVIAIVAALALFGVVMVTVSMTMQLQEAEAFHRGCPLESPTANASKAKCVRP